MGEDPNVNDYIAGCRCVACEDLSFDGVTPKYILATVSGVEICPPPAVNLPNGAWLLTQHPTICCLWNFLNDDFDMNLQLGAVYGFGIFAVDPINDFVFFDDTGGPCGLSFESIFTVCDGGALTKNGIAEMTWGPSIHP